jgi:hypothetical protein
MVKIAEEISFFVWASWARNGRFEPFFEKNDLRLLGINVSKVTHEKLQVLTLY